MIGNGQFTDGGIRLSPRSFPGDGVLDGLVFTGPRSNAYRLAAADLPARRPRARPVDHGGPREAEDRRHVRDAPLPVVADGLALGTTPVTFQVVPQQILLKV